MIIWTPAARCGTIQPRRSEHYTVNKLYHAEAEEARRKNKQEKKYGTGTVAAENAVGIGKGKSEDD